MPETSTLSSNCRFCRAVFPRPCQRVAHEKTRHLSEFDANKPGGGGRTSHNLGYCEVCSLYIGASLYSRSLHKQSRYHNSMLEESNRITSFLAVRTKRARNGDGSGRDDARPSSDSCAFIFSDESPNHGGNGAAYNEDNVLLHDSLIPDASLTGGANLARSFEGRRPFT